MNDWFQAFGSQTHNHPRKQNLFGQSCQTDGGANEEFDKSFRDIDHGQIGTFGQYGLRPKRSEVLRPQLKPS